MILLFLLGIYLLLKECHSWGATENKEEKCLYLIAFAKCI